MGQGGEYSCEKLCSMELSFSHKVSHLVICGTKTSFLFLLLKVYVQMKDWSLKMSLLSELWGFLYIQPGHGYKTIFLDFKFCDTLFLQIIFKLGNNLPDCSSTRKQKGREICSIHILIQSYKMLISRYMTKTKHAIVRKIHVFQTTQRSLQLKEMHTKIYHQRKLNNIKLVKITLRTAWEFW